MRRAAIAGVLASTVCACIPIPQTFSRERQICVMDTDTTFGTPPSTFAIATDPGPTELEVDAPAVAVVTMHGHLNGCNSFGFGSCEVTQEDDGSLTLKAKVPAVRLVGFLVCTSDQDAPQTICTLPPLPEGETVINAGKVSTTVTVPTTVASGCANEMDPG